MQTPANFATFVTNVSLLIGEVYNTDDVQSVAKDIATTVPCTTSQLTFGWTGLMPKMRPWFGARQPHQAAPQTYTVIPEPFENTYSIDRFTLDDDQYGVLYRTLPDMARQSKRQADYEIRDLIEAAGIQGANVRQLGPDGLTFWNTAHPIDIYNTGAGTYTNTTIGGSNQGGVTIGGPLSVTSFTSAFEYMMLTKGEDGERLGIRPNVLMHPIGLYAEVETMLKSTLLASPTWGAYSPLTGQVGTADNPLKRFGVTPLQNDFLSSQTQWYLLDTTKPVKPFLWVVRSPTVMVPRVNENDPAVFDSHMFQWGQWNRVCPGWNYSFLSHRSG